MLRKLVKKTGGIWWLRLNLIKEQSYKLELYLGVLGHQRE